MKKLYTDEQLVSLLASTQPAQVDEAIRQLYHQHKNMIFRLVRKNSGTQQDAEEVLDDALIGLWEAIRARRYQPTARLKTYLYQIARNIWLRQIRNAAKDVVLIDTELIDNQHHVKGVDELYEIREAFNAHWDKIRAVGETCYNVLWAFAEGYSMQEIADRFKLGSANNAKTTKYNCLKKVGKPANQ